MSQPMYEYKFLVLSDVKKYPTDAPTDPNGFKTWFDIQGTKLSNEMLLADYSGWEVLSHSVALNGGTTLLTVMLRRSV